MPDNNFITEINNNANLPALLQDFITEQVGLIVNTPMDNFTRDTSRANNIHFFLSENRLSGGDDSINYIKAQVDAQLDDIDDIDDIDEAPRGPIR